MNKLCKIFAGLCLLASCFGYAQNLVPNPSFEDTVHCPTTTNQLFNAQSWINPTAATPDYFNVCSTANGNVVHIPNNGYGTQNAHTGNAYVGFYAFNKFFQNVREYIQTGLTGSLVANHKYIVSFYLSLSDGSDYADDNIGIYFSNSQISSTSTLTLNYNPQIQSKATQHLTDQINWMLVSDTLTAQGGEQYITIGNFVPDNLSDTLYIGNYGGTDTYYYIDDVSVIDLANIGIQQYKSGNMQVNIYPNPANDILTVETSKEPGELKMIDVLGKEIKSEKINKSLQIDVSGLSEGVYLIKIISSNNISTQKILVQH